jgi:hypothetical protein
VLELALYTPESPFRLLLHASLSDKSRAYELLLVASGNITKLLEHAGSGHVITQPLPLQISHNGESSQQQSTPDAEKAWLSNRNGL